MDGVRLTFTDEALKAVAAESSKRKTGARGLRAIMEQTMMDLMYEIPSDDTILSCQVTEEMVKENKEPVLERRENKEKNKIPKSRKIIKKGRMMKVHNQEENMFTAVALRGLALLPKYVAHFESVVRNLLLL